MHFRHRRIGSILVVGALAGCSAGNDTLEFNHGDAAASSGGLASGNGGAQGSNGGASAGGVASRGGAGGRGGGKGGGQSSGGSPAAGGRTGSGGTRATGGNPANGGSPASGGTGSGGRVGSGGTIGSGGKLGSGGTIGSGGVVSSGGTIGSGGKLSSGGTIGSGGVVNSGGTIGSGGVVSSGGTIGSGGVLGNGGVVGSGGSGPDGGNGMDCQANGDCATREYCNTVVGGCGDVGTCTQIPVVCSGVFLPVCGCDHKTYGNTCQAAVAGVSVMHRGACPSACDLHPIMGCCFDDGDCTTDTRCVTASCAAKGDGVCVKNNVAPGECWVDADCGQLGVCKGASICACGVQCLIADSPGTCAVAGN